MRNIREEQPFPPYLREAYHFRRRRLLMDNLAYHFVDEGDPGNPPVLMLHGNPTWSFYYRELIRALAPVYRVVAPDHMGCGFSDKPQNYPYRLINHIGNVEKLVAHLDLQRITLVCHDWGGAIGMGVATRRPDLFSRFVILNTAAWRSGAMPKRIAACRIPFLGPLLVRGLNGFALSATRMAVNNPLDKTAMKGLLYPYDTWKHRIAILRFVQDIPMKPAHPSYGCLKEIEEGLRRLKNKPMLICWGMKDWCFNGVFLDEWRKRFPNAVVKELPNAGHYILEDAHEEVVAAIKGFLRSTKT